MLDQTPLRRGALAPPPRTLVDVLDETTAHSTLTRPIAKKFCMSMPSTFFVRTMPP